MFVQCDVFSLGITLYEIISGRPLPPNGDEWHSLRSGKAGMPMGLPAELSKTLHEMMHVSPPSIHPCLPGCLAAWLPACLLLLASVLGLLVAAWLLFVSSLLTVHAGSG